LVEEKDGADNQKRSEKEEDVPEVGADHQKGLNFQREVQVFQSVQIPIFEGPLNQASSDCPLTDEGCVLALRNKLTPARCTSRKELDSPRANSSDSMRFCATKSSTSARLL
jgi:hypothetical protein